jgi:hypothetical protein
MTKFSSSFSRWARPARTSVSVIFIMLSAAPLFGDGGTLRLTHHFGKYQISVFTSPTLLRAGPVDISVLVQDAHSEQVRADVPVTIQLQRIDQTGSIFLQPATAAAATNKLFRAALFDIPDSGVWKATISIGESATRTESVVAAQNPALLTFEFEVAPPPPPWLQLAPWVGWPFALAGLFVLHQRLVYRRERFSRFSPALGIKSSAATHTLRF